MIPAPRPIPAGPYLALAVATYLVMQAATVITHEFTHSTMAWLLSDIGSPADIVWGNPVMMTGWDEGVGYRHLFAVGKDLQGAIIGICPLIMHSAVIAMAFHLMGTRWLMRRRWLFHAVYWLSLPSLMELVAYVWMRSFASGGDIGNFVHGTGISPWFIFIPGSLALCWTLHRFYRLCMPRLQALFTPHDRAGQWGILLLTTCILFLWGSGIRVMAYVPGPQWMFGLMGLPAAAYALVRFRPGWEAREPGTAPAA